MKLIDLHSLNNNEYINKFILAFFGDNFHKPATNVVNFYLKSHETLQWVIMNVKLFLSLTISVRF